MSEFECLNPQCKAPESPHHAKGLCSKCYHREWYFRNKGRHNEASKAYRKEHQEWYKAYRRNHYKLNGEEIRKKNNLWYAGNKERRNKKTKEWDIANPGYRRKWRQNNKMKIKVYHSRRRAQKIGNGGSLNHEDMEWLKTLQLGQCINPYCTNLISEKNPITVDHVIPLSRGGKNDIANVQMLCLSCNCKKHTNIADWRTKAVREAAHQRQNEHYRN